MSPPDHATDPPAGGDHDVWSLLRQAEVELRRRGYARSTRQGYMAHVLRFLAISEREGDTPPGTEAARAHLQWMTDERGYSSGYVNQCVSALRFLYRHVCPGTADPDAIARHRVERRPPAVLRRREVAAVLNRAERPVYRAILLLTYAAGLRVSEVVRLRPGDLDPDRGVLRISAGASAEPREVMLPEIALVAVRASGTHKISRRWLFPGRRAGESMGKASVQAAFRRARDAAGIDRPVGVHVLRHSFAVHLLERGVATDLVQELLGHRCPQSTRVYTAVAHRRPAHSLRSPLVDLEGLEPPAG